MEKLKKIKKIKTDKELINTLSYILNISEHELLSRTKTAWFEFTPLEIKEIMDGLRLTKKQTYEVFYGTNM